MTFRSAILRARSRLLLAGVLLASFGAWSNAEAADVAPILKAPPPDTGWYFHGGFEAGGRFFIERPGSGFAKSSGPLGWETPPTIDSRAKFEEYGRIPEGLFLDWINFNAGSKDGRYAIDFWGRNVGLNSQGYLLDIAEVGKHYFTFGFEGTPHLISTSAKSIYSGVGTDRLTVDQTTKDVLSANSPSTAAQQARRNNIDAYINGPAPIGNIDLYTQRDKFFTAYRWTGNPDWDVKADYSNELRTGVRPLGIGFGKGAAANPRPSTGALEVPQPIDDTTQNFGTSGEYVGSTPWGTKFNTKLAYAGSTYENRIKFMDVDNPFCGGVANGCSPAGVGGNFGGGPILRYGLYPDNSAHAINWNTGVDLPFFKSRYMSTVQYQTMLQNDPFIDTNTNGITIGGGATQLRPYPAPGLNGEMNSFLTNNVLTSRLTSEVSNTARVRYYRLKDNTPLITFNNYVYADGGVSSTQPLTRNPATYSYDKLNVSDELKWRATKNVAVGGGYFFQRTGFDNFQLTDIPSQIDNEVRALNEHKGRIFTDFTPVDWANGKVMYEYSQRRYDGYIDTGNVQTRPQRVFMVANRDRHKADGHIEFAVVPNVLVTPNAGMRWDDYPDDVANLLGVTKDHSWNAGVELGVRINSDARLSFAYNFEEHNLHMAVCCGAGGAAAPPANTWQSDVKQHYNTFIAALDWKPIPNRLDVRLEYVFSHALESNATTPCPALADGCTGAGTGVTLGQTQFPDEKAQFQRFNVIARYNVDPDTLRAWGWTGEAFVKARYTFERNRVANYAIDTMTPYSPSPADAGGDTTNGGSSLFLAYNNPNYTAQFVALSFGLKW